MIYSKNIAPDAGILSTQLKSGLGMAASQLTVASAKVIVGTSGGVGAAVTLSGDVTNDNTGVTAIGAGKVTNAMVAPNALDGTVVKNCADAGVIGAIPVVHTFTIANEASADHDIVLTHKTKITDVVVVKTLTASLNNAANTITVKSTATAITDAMNIRNISSDIIVRNASLVTASATIAAGGTLRVSTTKSNGSDDNSVQVYVFGVRSA